MLAKFSRGGMHRFLCLATALRSNKRAYLPENCLRIAGDCLALPSRFVVEGWICVAFSAGMAVVVPDLDTALALTGSSTCTIIAFIYPALLFVVRVHMNIASTGTAEVAHRTNQGCACKVSVPCACVSASRRLHCEIHHSRATRTWQRLAAAIIEKS